MFSNLKHTETSFAQISNNLLCLQHAQMPRSRDLAIFVLMITTDIHHPLRTCAWGNTPVSSMTLWTVTLIVSMYKAQVLILGGMIYSEINAVSACLSQ